MQAFSPMTGVLRLARFAAPVLLATAFLHAQTISDIQPKTGPATTWITITGSGFGKNPTVTFGGAPAAAIQDGSTDTKIVALPFDLKAPVNASLDVVVTNTETNKQSGAMGFTETMPPIMPASGPAGTKIRISGTGLGSKGAKSAISFNEQPVPDLAVVTDWSTTGMTVTVPDAGARMNVYLRVVVTDADGKTHDIGEFKETPGAAPAKPADVTLNPSSGYGGTSVKITGKGFNDGQGARVLKFDGAVITPTKWSDVEIDAKLPAFDPPQNDTPVDLTIEDGSGTQLFKAQFTKSPATATLSAHKGVAGDAVTIGGSNFPDVTKGGKVLFDDTAAAVRSTPSAGPNAITVSAPDLGVPPEGKSDIVVKVKDANDNVVAQSKLTFNELPDLWGDKDENPLDIKFIAGYEQGWLSSQNSSNNAFLAVYGRKTFRFPSGNSTDAKKKKGSGSGALGPYFAVRLLTAPQSGDNYNVTSVFTDPAGQIKTTDFKTVGSAVDFTGGLEWQFKKLARGRVTLSTIAGAGFTTPANANSIAQTYQMPGFGTVECTALQARLAPILMGKNYTNIAANTTPDNGACFSNTAVKDPTTKLPTPIKFLNYAAPDAPSFFPKYSGGIRLINRWPGTNGGPHHCTEADPCERGYVDFLLGQNATLTGGKLQHGVLAIDSTYPFPVPNLNYLYLFGTFSKRFGDLPHNLDPLVLQSGTATGGSGTTPPPTAPDPSILIVPLAQPDRDFYRIGVGVNVGKVFTALTGQTKQQ